MNTKSEKDSRSSYPFSKRSISLKTIFAGLFFQPRILLNLAVESWTSALKTGLTAIFICALTLGFQKNINTMRIATDWAAWFENRMGELTVKDGEMNWRRPEKSPATFWRNSYRVDFMPEDAEFTETKTIQEGRHGLWISPDSVYWWRRNRDNEIVGQPLWIDGKIFGQIETAAWLGDPIELGPGEFVTQTRQWVWRILIPLIFVTEILKVGFFFFFYTLVFAVVPFIIRSSMSSCGFAGVHAFYLYTGVPPLVIATVYSLFPMPWLDFNSLFVIGFLVYLGFIAWRSGRELNEFLKKS